MEAVMEEKILAALAELNGKFDTMHSDLQDMKADIADLKTDMAEVKAEQKSMKADIAEVKGRAEGHESGYCRPENRYG
jgi:outer membrane murein-binding lipoprotein Lpp